MKPWGLTTLTRTVWVLIPNAEMQFHGFLYFLKEQKKKLVAVTCICPKVKNTTVLWKSLPYSVGYEGMWFLCRLGVICYQNILGKALWFHKGLSWSRTLMNERNSRKRCGDEKKNLELKHLWLWMYYLTTLLQMFSCNKTMTNDIL